MVGLKTFWITITLLFLGAACVPQTKQSSCKSNEAFNSSLRTCVPIIGGPESFVNIDDYVPHFAVSKSKSDYSTVDFTITVSNPYNQTYTIAWERVFNGTPEPISGSTNQTTISLMPAYLGQNLGQIGIHLVTAKIYVGTLLVDSHSFELKINELPKPTINAGSVLPVPNVTTLSYTPLDGPQTFSFNINNNADLNMSHNWKTTWTVLKNSTAYMRGGTTTLDDIDPFVNYFASETNTAALGDTPAMRFNPSVDGVGLYTIRAIVSNDIPGEVVEEKTWYVTVKYPDVPKVTARNIYQSIGTPSFTTVINAYNGVAYNSSSAYNFIPSNIPVTFPATAANQADFCVTVANGDGTFPGGNGVRVDYYLDGSTLVYSGETSSLDSTVCLSDTPNPENVIFANPSPTGTVTHTIMARVIDVDSNTEYTTNDLYAGLGTYPITWSVNVKPDNAAPTVAFTSTANLSGLTCGTISGTSRTCTVPQDTPFVVGVTATDDFYSTSSTNDNQQDKLAYTMTLLRNGTAIQTCSKTFADVADTNTAGSDFVGPDYLCSFTVPSFDANGPVNPLLYSYSVSIAVSDSGSPISGSTAKSSNTYTYNLTPVTEVNTAPTIGAQGATIADTHFASASAPGTVIESSANPLHFITEGETLNMNILVSDNERDNHQIIASLCSDASCVTSSQVSLVNVTKTNNSLTTMSSLSYVLPENLIPINTPIGTNVPVYFKISVTDSTHTLGAGLTSTPLIMSVNVRNKNPAPVIGGTPTPALAASLTAMVGYPLTIDPGTVTDASLVSSEGTIGYQWYVDPTGLGTGFTAITGATARRLVWTPSNALTSGSTVNLRLCVHDNTAVNPLPTGAAIGTTLLNGANGPNCLGNWNVTVRPNAVAINQAAVNMTAPPAVWQDTTVSGKRVVYAAYTDNDFIYINKIVFTANGFINTAASPGFRTVQFPPLLSGAAATNSVKDLSLVGAGNHLIVAYQAADSSNPSAPKIKMRKILKSNDPVNYGSKTDASYPHVGAFDYKYTGVLPTTTSPNVTITSVTGVDPYFSITFTGALTSGQVVNINGGSPTGDTFTVSDTPTTTQLCSGAVSGCSTNGNAALLASLINSSSNRELQGLSARAVGSEVQVYGAVGGQYLDSNTAVSDFIPGKMGKLVTDGTRWYLPFVDLGTAGAVNKVRVLNGVIAADFNSLTTIDNDDVLTAIGDVAWITNDLNNAGNLVIGSISTASRANMHVYNLSFSMLVNKQLFSNTPVEAESLRISSTVPGNPYYYAVAKVLTILPSTYEWKIGRYDASLIVSVEDTMSNLSQNASTASVLEDDEVVDIALQSSPAAVTSTEARMLVSSKAGGANVNLYSVRFRSDNKVSCDVCLPHNTGTQELSNTLRLSSTLIDLDMTIGAVGAQPNENQKDVFFSVHPQMNGANAIPVFSIINSKVESINSTTPDTTGTLGHRPPFYGAN